MTNGSLMKVKSIAECSLEQSAILLACINKQYIIGLENQFLVFFRVAVLYMFNCIASGYIGGYIYRPQTI